MPIEVAYTEDADLALVALEASNPSIYDRVVLVLMEFEATPGDGRWRRQR